MNLTLLLNEREAIWLCELLKDEQSRLTELAKAGATPSIIGTPIKLCVDIRTQLEDEIESMDWPTQEDYYKDKDDV